jgi:hypothetical protein
MNNSEIKGRWFITLYGPDGKEKAYREGHNVIVTDGKNYLAAFLNSAATAAATFTMKYVAIGSNNTGEAVGDSALGTETSRTTGTVSYVSAIYEVTATFAAGSGTGNVYEYGLFSVPTAACGTMFSRDTEGLITKAAGDTLKVVTRVEFS